MSLKNSTVEEEWHEPSALDELHKLLCDQAQKEAKKLGRGAFTEVSFPTMYSTYTKLVARTKDHYELTFIITFSNGKRILQGENALPVSSRSRSGSTCSRGSRS